MILISFQHALADYRHNKKEIPSSYSAIHIQKIQRGSFFHSS
jgi:hypothetical protein